MRVVHLRLPTLASPSPKILHDLFEKPIEVHSSGHASKISREQADKLRSGSPTFRAADLTRAIRAVRKAGETVSGSEITRDGTIRIVHSTSPEAEGTPFDQWKARRDAGAA